MKARFAFTMLELVFVIVVMGILAKFGVEFIAQSYKSYLFTKTNAYLQDESEAAVEIIAKRLQYRIKDSVIARKSAGGTPVAIGSASGDDYTILEWIGSDNEGFRGSRDNNNTDPNWSGIIDLNSSSASLLTSPSTDTTQENELIKALVDNNNTTIDEAALYFIGSNSNAVTDYGWDGNLTHMQSQKGALHPVKRVSGNITQFQSSTTHDFSGVDVYEYYKLAWSAYALVLDNNTLKLYYNYQPWLDRNGDGDTDQFNDAPNVKSMIVMENVSSFRFMAIGSILKIEVCVKSNLLEKDGGEYSLCKEKTIL